MRPQRFLLFGLLLIVAGAAAVLSFAALRDLALLCGFAPSLAWLLPVVVDAGAAAGSLVWLGQWSPPDADRYARALALLLLGGSVAGNALGHGLEAYGVQPHWLVVVAVSAIAPTVLGALVHLMVLVGRPEAAPAEPPTELPVAPALGDEQEPNLQGLEGEPETVEERAARLIAEGAGRKRLVDELEISEWKARQLLATTNGATA
ncbi:DUF2637 domain-containing protein [Pseudonocardia sp. KRD-184]|uniref:DUF2637 domain-containing protein n=1 Tax=Pseudonocardia oceani TaxID=2792013 RepID=A0ABS6UJZ3_9PSEU|nr:DUF2637 domain-containing protein [Pseudonocardia oceani]MBW0090508.1 DUF2637 domain-containing protein [Pseudonocardia oceani]MBW0098539.1 DUF2637 domain-containing protein [Pseudonocardia oceani]MBW0124379.1 DUF2637 domain-containing protein [Pseudonocardia oceani]MBW0131149.1 DUF2637 domain-containing protein [Pseudonocardia oceani]MBW0132589.1 DUF2637 domain-containing protein [Pseudonocardia oceani]